MLQQIIVNTPIWVWALLAFLIYRGFVSSVDREVPLKKVVIIPVLMLALSILGIASTFGLSAAAALSWLPFVVVSAALTWVLFNPDSVRAFPDKGTVLQRGSWTPMILMMGIFLTKYIVAVILAREPGHAHELLFAVGVCALYGLFSGVFLGRTLRVFAAYRGA
jgi:hypothetical protein